MSPLKWVIQASSDVYTGNGFKTILPIKAFEDNI